MSIAVDPSDYEPLCAFSDRFGSVCGPKQFYWTVDDTFQTAQTSLYEQMHAGMFRGAEPMWRRSIAHLPARPVNILDIGCGSGVAGTYLAAIAPEKV